MKRFNNIVTLFLVVTLFGCDSVSDKSDAYGNFEAIEIFVSAKANGEILEFNLEEGDLISENQQIGRASCRERV